MVTIPAGGGELIFEAHGNTAELILTKRELVKRRMPEDVPEGFDRPPENYVPIGSGLPEDIFDPDTSPDINEPDTIGDPGSGEPEPPSIEPDIVSDIDPTPGVDPVSDTDPTPDADPTPDTDPN